VNELEHRIMELLLAGDLQQLASLRQQLASARIAGREYSGVGAFVTFEVAAETPRVTPPNFQLTDIHFELEGVENGGSVVLFIRNGVLDMLEIYNWTDQWPKEPRLKSISYLVPIPSDIESGASLRPSTARDAGFLHGEIHGHPWEKRSA
jgi:hypothetical protein